MNTKLECIQFTFHPTLLSFSGHFTTDKGTVKASLFANLRWDQCNRWKIFLLSQAIRVKTDYFKEIPAHKSWGHHRWLQKHTLMFSKWTFHLLRVYYHQGLWTKKEKKRATTLHLFQDKWDWELIRVHSNERFCWLPLAIAYLPTPSTKIWRCLEILIFKKTFHVCYTKHKSWEDFSWTLHEVRNENRCFVENLMIVLITDSFKHTTLSYFAL